MCGIMGFSGSKNAKQVILDGLHALEYRGYDSAGLSVLDKDGLHTVKCSGRVDALEELCASLGDDAYCGIGHTRWATHGEPSSKNAHPHVSNKVVLVHNGIIDNYLELKNMLIADGYTFQSETDTESIVHLIDREFQKNPDPKAALMAAGKYLKGSYAIAVMFEGFEGEIWATRRDNPLIVAKGQDGTYLASDIPALIPYAKAVIRPDENEIIRLDKDSITLFDAAGNQKDYVEDEIKWNIGTAQKEGYAHFMLKEMYEQPKAVRQTALQHLDENGLPDLSSIGISDGDLEKIDSVSIVACGSATHAGLVGKCVIEQLAKIPVFVTAASEYRYNPPVTAGNTFVISVSQSGETADTLAALRLAKSMGARSLGIINAVGSAIARESDWVYYTNAGPEIAVATTKGYTTQLAAFCILAVAIARAKKLISDEQAKSICHDLAEGIPQAMENILSRRDEIRTIAEGIYQHDDLYFIGRGLDNYAGVECSLKLKEISYIHSEAYAAGELKHGTLSLIVDGTPVIALACDEKYYDKMIGNIREITARLGKVVLVCQEDFPSPAEYANEVFVVPPVPAMLSPFVSVVFSQLMAYEVALLRGCDVDHPRNLAKSVTVE